LITGEKGDGGRGLTPGKPKQKQVEKALLRACTHDPKT
jgi:hypothetical protein